MNDKQPDQISVRNIVNIMLGKPPDQLFISIRNAVNNLLDNNEHMQLKVGYSEFVLNPGGNIWANDNDNHRYPT